MKLFLSFTFILFTSVLSSQPIISFDVMLPSDGDSINYFCDTISGFDPGPAGEAVIWDFSSIASGPNLTNYFWAASCGNIGSTEEFTPFGIGGPWLSWWGSTWGTTERQIIVDDSSFSFCWIGGLEFQMNFDEPFKVFRFPLTYGLENMSSFTGLCDDGIFEEGAPDPFAGSSNMIVDGYGTLILVTGVFTDVLRVKVVDDISCNYGQIESYYWFKEGITYPLFKYLKNINDNAEFEFVRQNDPVIVPILDIQPDISVYPNPADEFLIVDGIESATAEIYNLNGQLISIQEILNTGAKISLLMLNDGIYLLKIFNSNSATTQIFEKRN